MSLLPALLIARIELYYFGEALENLLKSSDNTTRTALARASKRYEDILTHKALNRTDIANEILVQQLYERLKSYAQKLAFKASRVLDPSKNELIGKFVIARLKTLELFDFRNRTHLFEATLLESLNSNKPITFFLSRCLRYYYPNGELAIIPHCDDQEYTNLSGMISVKKGETLLNELKHDCELPLILQILGFNAEIIMPVMDNELRRPAEMNTEKNKGLSKEYVVNLQQRILQTPEFRSLNVTVLQGSELFDFGSTVQEKFFEEVNNAIHYSNQNDYGVPNYMLEAEVGRVTGVFRDPERLSRYNQNEFPRERVIYNTCDGVYMALNMTKLSPSSAGVFALMPKGGEYICKVYESNPNLCVYMPK